jgi:hypothetical protein
LARLPDVSEPGWFVRLAQRVARRRLGKPSPGVAVCGHHPRILLATGVFQTLLEGSNRVPARLKSLAQLRVAMRVGCPV